MSASGLRMDVNGRSILCLSSDGLMLVLTSIIVNGLKGGGGGNGGGGGADGSPNVVPAGGMRGGNRYVRSYCMRGGICKDDDDVPLTEHD